VGQTSEIDDEGRIEMGVSLLLRAVWPVTLRVRHDPGAADPEVCATVDVPVGGEVHAVEQKIGEIDLVGSGIEPAIVAEWRAGGCRVLCLSPARTAHVAHVGDHHTRSRVGLGQLGVDDGDGALVHRERVPWSQPSRVVGRPDLWVVAQTVGRCHRDVDEQVPRASS
jgi:hypothetical protein